MGHADQMEPGNLDGITTRNRCLGENSVNRSKDDLGQ